jgi:RHS repeat-associated protein
MIRPRRLLVAAVLALVLVPSSPRAQSGFRYVNAADPTCQGESPCYTSIQAAVNAATAGEHVVVQAGTYHEQVAITGKNNTASATEADRIVIEADAAAAVGSVVVQGSVSQCTNGYAFRLQQSKFITIRGLTITGAGGQAISLLGGNNQNQAIHLERLRIVGNGSGSCDGGITIARGNPGTLILNSLIHGNGRNGFSTVDADGGPHYLIGNTIHGNQWSGVSVTRNHETYLVNNAITGNGVVTGSTGGRFGVTRESSTSPNPAGIHLLNNFVCGNRLGEINGPALDATDSGNLTPTAAEGPGVTAAAGCSVTSNVYGDANGPDGVASTADDDFTPVTASPLLDAGLDPRTLGLDAAFNPLLESDYLKPAARPRLGRPGGTARFDIGAREPAVADETAPLVTILAPPADSYVRLQVPVAAQATDAGSGVATFTLRIGTQALTTTLTPSIPPAAPSVSASAVWNTTAFADGAYTLTAETEDAAGHPASTTRVLIVDNTSPDTLITSGPTGEVATTAVTFVFTGTDNLTPAPGLQFAWRLDGAAWSAFSGATTAGFRGLSETTHTFDVKARDLAGNENATPASRTFTVRVSPSISLVQPSTGTIGTYVTITGTKFEPGSTSVTFNGLSAVLRTVTATQITTTVPIAATTGPLTVTTSRGTVSALFTVTLTGDFTLTASPGSVRAIAGDQASVNVTIAGGGSFTNFVAPSVSPSVTGIAATFGSPFIAPGTNTPLTFRVDPGVAAGLYIFTVRGQASVDGGTVSHTAAVTLEVLPADTLAVTGRIMTAESIPQPIPGVSVALGSAFALTDAGGNFVLLAPPTGPNMLFVDGRTASTTDAQFPIVEVNLTVAATGPSRVPFTIYLPKLDTGNAINLPIDGAGFTTQEVKATTPRIPGLEVTIPAGTRIVGPDGNPVAQLVITPVPIDRSPMPFPSGKAAPLLFAINPGGSVPSNPLPISFPNITEAAPGTHADMYYFDLAIGGWNTWGTGTVSADGRHVVSDPGYGLPRLAWHWWDILRDKLKKLWKLVMGGDPVDLPTGTFMIDKTDLVIPARVPISIQRHYRSDDTRSGFFGVGWNLGIYDSRITSSGATLNYITPDQNVFRLTPQGTGQWVTSEAPNLIGAVATQLPGEFNFQIRFKDGTVHRFDRIVGFANTAGLSSITDRNGNVVTITRSSTGPGLFGLITQITEPAGRHFTLSYDGAGRITSITDPINRLVAYSYDAAGRLASVTDAAGGVTHYAYDGTSARMASITDPRNITYLTIEYDADGRVSRQTQADGGVWQFDYLVAGDTITQTTITDPRGNATVHRFNTTSFPLSMTDPLGGTTTYEYAPGSNLRTAMTDALGRTTRWTYDAQGNVASITDAAGAVRAFTYEPTFNQLATVQDPLSHRTRFEQDAHGNLTAVVDPLTHRTTLGYDALGQVTSVSDPLTNTTTFGYDPAGNLTTITDPLNHVTTRDFDAVGRPLRQLDARGKATALGYDPLNRLTRISDPGGNATAFSYDGNGNLLAVTDARGNTTSYAYDAMDRTAARTDPLGASETFEYDGAGNLTRHVDRKGQVATFTYDTMNRPVTRQDANGTTTLHYDAAGQTTLAADTTGGTLSYTYDGVGRPTGEHGLLGSLAYGYDVAGRRTTMQAPGVPPVTYDYDAASRLTAVTQPSLAAATLAYDDANRRTRLTLPNGVSTEYSYDAASRLTALIYRNATGPLGDLAYDYDAAGNRMGVGGSYARTLLPAAVPGASYDAGNRQLAFGETTLTYDANGSLTALGDSSGVTQFGWDARSRLASVATPAATATFTYDAHGRRVTRQLGAEQTRFLYDGIDIVQDETSAASLSYLRLPTVDEPLARGGTEFYLSDAIGSTVALTDQDGAVATTYAYEPFGATADSTSSNPFQFTAREKEPVGGLYYYRARYYHPGLQRFISEDRIGLAGGPNLYAYVDNRPLDLVDPLGLDAFVRIYRSSKQPAGHAGIGVNTTATVGFHPVESAADLDILLLRPVPGRVVSDKMPHLTPKETFRIPTSKKQDECLTDFIGQRTANPGDYWLGGRSCGEFVRDALRSCDIKGVGPEGLAAPYGLADRLRLHYERLP